MTIFALDLLLRSGMDLWFLIVGLILLDAFLEGDTPVLNRSFWSKSTERCAKKQILQLLEY
jgi:hypothetical protein